MDVTQKKIIPLVEHQLDIGNFTFYRNIIIGEFKEGIHVTFENATIPIQIATQLYSSEEPIIYISHRKNSYSMDAVGYKEVVDLFPNFMAFGIVAKNKRRRMLAHLERLFIKKPIRVFEDLDDALFWAREFLKKECKT
ncbi:MAG: hypothetical protein AB8B59_01045 [Maribacter sp.]